MRIFMNLLVRSMVCNWYQRNVASENEKTSQYSTMPRTSKQDTKTGTHRLGRIDHGIIYSKI